MSPAERRLIAELDALAVPRSFWWRDDDAGRDAPGLHRLLALASDRRAELALAVVPEWLDVSTRRAICACMHASVLQHGINHTDHAAPGAKRIELGGAAATETLMAKLAAGMGQLRAAFPARFLAVVVPPWNRIAASLLPRLGRLGFVGLSRFGPRAAPQAAPGIHEINTHLDLIDWRQDRRPLALAEAIAKLVAALRAAPAEPIGILSHHLVMDEAAFGTLDRLLGLLQDHPKARLMGTPALFSEAE